MAQYVAHGLNETNVAYIRDVTGAITAGDFTTTIPANMRGKGWLPVAASVAEAGAGAIGARVLTHRALVLKSYNEASGVLTITAGANVAAGAFLTVIMVTAGN